MSTICTFFVFLLCLSMHACNARNLGVVDKVSSLEFVVSDKVQLTESIQGRGTNGENIGDMVKGGATTQKPKDSKPPFKGVKYIRGKIPGLVPVKPLVSVSRRMPRKNHDEHPGFYSDYSRPKTRPPSHN